jgi:hypothetical protein
MSIQPAEQQNEEIEEAGHHIKKRHMKPGHPMKRTHMWLHAAMNYPGLEGLTY